MTTNAASLEVFTIGPSNDQISLREKLLTSLSSPDSIEDPLPPSPHPQKFRQKSRVQFAQPNPPLKNGPRERIKVDEVDDDTHPVREEKVTRALSRSRSTLRGAGGPRSASRPARRRTLSRGRPISRDTTSDQPDMTPEQIARELRPESFTRFKRITLSDNKDDTSINQIDTPTPGQIKDFDFEREAKDMKERFEQTNSPASLSPAEEMDPDAINTTCFQEVKLPETEALDLNISREHQGEEK